MILKHSDKSSKLIVMSLIFSELIIPKLGSWLYNNTLGFTGVLLVEVFHKKSMYN